MFRQAKRNVVSLKQKAGWGWLWMKERNDLWKDSVDVRKERGEKRGQYKIPKGKFALEFVLNIAFSFAARFFTSSIMEYFILMALMVGNELAVMLICQDQ